MCARNVHFHLVLRPIFYGMQFIDRVCSEPLQFQIRLFALHGKNKSACLNFKKPFAC